MFKKREYLVLGILLLSAFAAVAPTILASLPVKRDGAFITSAVAFDSLGSGQPGGRVALARAPYGDSLFIGDVVYYNADNQVTVSTTLAAYNTLAGVIVGGSQQTNLESVISADDVGTLAAFETTTNSTTPQYVWILKFGRTWIKADGNGSIAAGEQVIPSVSSTGQIRPRTTAIDTFHRVLGRAVKAGAASATIPVDVNVPR